MDETDDSDGEIPSFESSEEDSDEDFGEMSEFARARRAKMSIKWKHILELAPKINKVLMRYSGQGITSDEEMRARLEYEHPDFYSCLLLTDTFSSPESAENIWYQRCKEAREIIYRGIIH